MSAFIFSIFVLLSTTGDCYAWERYNDAFPNNAKYMNPVSLNETLRQIYADNFQIKPVIPFFGLNVFYLFTNRVVICFVGIRGTELQS